MQPVIRGLVLFLHGLILCASHAADVRLTSNEVARVLSQAIARAEQIAPDAVIAVADLEGFVLGVWSVNGAAPDPINVLDAITKAGTASFLSSDQHAFSSRTAGFIVQQNFPPGVRNRPPGPLVGVNFSNLSFSDVNRFKNPHAGRNMLSTEGGTNGAPIAGPAPLTGLAGSPGGVPLFREGRLVGGVGVAGHARTNANNPFPPLADIQLRQRYDPDEDVARAGQLGFVPGKVIHGSRVFIDGIRVPYLKGKARRARNVQPLGSLGSVVPPYEITGSPEVVYPTDVFGGDTCEIRAPIMDDPIPGEIDGQPRLTAAEVRQLLEQAAARARITRAGIRLPRGQPAQVFVAVVNNPNAANAPPAILGTIRTPAATLFSWDVAVQKARTALFFSDSTRAFSTRTVGFLAQKHFPPGIAGTPPGPLYTLQEKFSLLPVGVRNPLNNVTLTEALSTPDPDLPNGLTIFPGGFPLYRNGVLVGAIGVSGDGVDQDDIIGAAGTVGFLPPPSIRADHMEYRGARLPYAKFPRNPDL